MSLTSFILGCFIHIILILVFEGVFLFVILFPLITNIANKLTDKYNKVIFDLLLKNGFGEYIEITYSDERDKELYKNNTINEIISLDLNGTLFKNGKITYNFKYDINAIIKGCAVNEALYMKINKYMPQIVYSIILFVLVVSCVILIIIAKIYKININYLYIFVSSLIIFILVTSYAFVVLWYTLTQPYVLNIDKGFYEVIYEFVKY